MNSLLAAAALSTIISQALLAGIAAGQLEDPDLFDPILDYDILPSIESKDAPFTDYIPIHDDRDSRFLEGLVIEAGRHTMFPELYLPPSEEGPYDDAGTADIDASDGLSSEKKKLSPKFYEMSGQPELEQSYTNRLNRRGRAECPEECPVYRPVCGSDGKVYPSECHLLKENCGSTNVSKGSWEKCHGKHYLCPSRCLDISDPVCASDGHIYQNVCIMRKRNCGKLLQVLPLKKCYGDMKQWKSDTSCPEKCAEIPQPACGSDGVIYFNECFMRMRTCRTGIVNVDMENCVHIPRCPEVCLPIYDPVCGSDSKLYVNQCRMLQQNCGKAMKKMPASFCRPTRKLVTREPAIRENDWPGFVF